MSARWKSDSQATAAREVRARREHRCWNCHKVIGVGEVYLSNTLWPNWETNQSDRPLTVRRHTYECLWYLS